MKKFGVLVQSGNNLATTIDVQADYYSITPEGVLVFEVPVPGAPPSQMRRVVSAFNKKYWLTFWERPEPHDAVDTRHDYPQDKRSQ